MKMPSFSKMTVEALMMARSTIDGLLTKRVPRARRDLEKKLSALNDFPGTSRHGAKSGARADGRSKLKGRSVPPKYRAPNGETWSGRGLKPRWLAAAISDGADLEDFAIGAGARKKKGKKASPKRRKKQASAKPNKQKRKGAKSAKKKVVGASKESTPQAADAS